MYVGQAPVAGQKENSAVMHFVRAFSPVELPTTPTNPEPSIGNSEAAAYPPIPTSPTRVPSGMLLCQHSKQNYTAFAPTDTITMTSVEPDRKPLETPGETEVNSALHAALAGSSGMEHPHETAHGHSFDSTIGAAPHTPSTTHAPASHNTESGQSDARTAGALGRSMMSKFVASAADLDEQASRPQHAAEQGAAYRPMESGANACCL
jgi:hypothetical protein